MMTVKKATTLTLIELFNSFTKCVQYNVDDKMFKRIVEKMDELFFDQSKPEVDLALKIYIDNEPATFLHEQEAFYKLLDDYNVSFVSFSKKSTANQLKQLINKYHGKMSMKPLTFTDLQTSLFDNSLIEWLPYFENVRFDKLVLNDISILEKTESVTEDYTVLDLVIDHDSTIDFSMFLYLTRYVINTVFEKETTNQIKRNILEKYFDLIFNQKALLKEHIKDIFDEGNINGVDNVVNTFCDKFSLYIAKVLMEEEDILYVFTCYSFMFWVGNLSGNKDLELFNNCVIMAWNTNIHKHGYEVSAVGYMGENFFTSTVHNKTFIDYLLESKYGDIAAQEFVIQSCKMYMNTDNMKIHFVNSAFVKSGWKNVLAYLQPPSIDELMEDIIAGRDYIIHWFWLLNKECYKWDVDCLCMCGNKNKLVMNCGHWMCEFCVFKVMNYGKCCPKCRKPISKLIAPINEHV